MSTFLVPTGPAITQGNLAYNVPKEEARRAKRPIMTARRGSLAYDREKGGMTLDWANEAKFQEWLAAEESEKSIELIVSQIKVGFIGNLAGAACISVFARIHGWEAQLPKEEPMGKKDPIEEDRLPMLPDNQAIPGN